MYRVGEVVQVHGEKAQVKLVRHSACGKCKACKIGEDDGSVYSDAYNEMGAIEGDIVEISLKESNILSAATILYLVPLTVMLLSIFAVDFILKKGSFAHNELILGVTALVSLAVSFIVIKMKDAKFEKSKKYIPVVTKIVEKG